MSAPVSGFTAEVLKGLGGSDTDVSIEPEPDYDAIEITLVQQRPGESYRTLLLPHDEARQIIAGLASVIT